VTGFVRTAVRRRPHPDGSGRAVDVADDVVLAQVEFENGALGTLEASWVCAGRKNQLRIEIDGAEGSLAWDLEDLNRLRVHRAGAERIGGVRGFEDALVTDPDQPGLAGWWPPGHVLGWEHLHANLIHHLVRAIAEDQPVGPCGATFEDGYRAALVGAAIEEASRAGRCVAVEPVDA
jgi:predicted dehydrogenase